MRKQMTFTQFFLRNALIVFIVAIVLAMMACSTVRDVTDWVPGVDSNEEAQAKANEEAQALSEQQRINYKNRTVYAPASNRVSEEEDARISVDISQQYDTSELINREDIGIEVNAGVVTLTGHVDANESAVNAITIAKSRPGVVRVISKLVVIKLRN